MVSVVPPIYRRCHDVCTGVSFNRHCTRNGDAFSLPMWKIDAIHLFLYIAAYVRCSDSTTMFLGRTINIGERRIKKKKKEKRTRTISWYTTEPRKENMKIWKMRGNSCTAEIYNLGEKEQTNEKCGSVGAFQCSMHDRLLQTRLPSSHILLRCANAHCNDKQRTDEKNLRKKKFKYLPFIWFAAAQLHSTTRNKNHEERKSHMYVE